MEVQLLKIGTREATELNSEHFSQLKIAQPGDIRIIGHILWGEYQSAIYMWNNQSWQVFIAKDRPGQDFLESIPDVHGAEVSSKGLVATVVILTDRGLKVCLEKLIDFFGQPLDQGTMSEATVAECLKNVFNL